MGDLRAYDIPFTGLKNGEYDFLYEIDDSFFMSFQESPILNGDVTVNLAFDKKPNFFICKFDLKGSVITECDRCLGELDLNIEGYYQVIIKFKDHNGELEQDDLDIIYIPIGSNSINVAQLIYEYINLCIPIQKTHELDDDNNFTCNNEVATILNNSIADGEGSDPRWEDLNKLKIK